MNYYRVFMQERGDVEAVKIGWSWPALFFGAFWAAYKKMWGVATVFFFSEFLGGFVSGFGNALMQTEPSEDAAVLQWVGDIALGLLAFYIGLKGNDWYAAALVKRGFRHAAVIVAPDPGRAKIIFDKEYHYDEQTDAWVKPEGILLSK